MPVPTQLSDLNAVAASNSPSSTDTISTTDDYLRAHASILARVSAGTDALTSPDINGGTIGGVTLDGNITSSGNPSLNLGTGALTAGSGTFSGAVTTTATTININNANAVYRFENGSGVRRGYIQSRADAFEVWSDLNVPTVFGANNTEAFRYTPGTGLAVMGGLSAALSGASNTLTVSGKSNAEATADVLISRSSGSTSMLQGPNITFYDGTYARNLQNGSGTLMFNYYNGSSWSTQATLDASGNLGVGVTPSAWGSYKSISVSNGLALYSSSSGVGNGGIAFNAYFDGANWKYRGTDYATNYYQYLGQHLWYTAPSGTAGNAITFTQAMTLDASGNLLVGATSGTRHMLQKAVSVGSIIFESGNGTIISHLTYAADATGANAANTVLALNKVSATSRSINAAGTINASGADYAEYERNNGLTITKGAIVGFKSDGTLTLTFSEAVRFGIKSTNPSYVGGDTWGSEDVVGKRPEKSEDQTDEEFATILDAWEAKLEAERQKVDRIAYSGKVPVNVLGAVAGDYIIAVDNNGQIDGAVITDPDFSQYKKAVGRVNRILEDGRAEVAVMVH